MIIPLFEAGQEIKTFDDYYTPRWLFEALGHPFDLDVAAPPGGVPWVPALRYFTKADDGLAQEWDGWVWMNPPFSNAAPWVDRFITHRSGIALLPFAKSAWCNQIWGEADGIVMLPSTFRFVGGSIFISTFLAAFGPTFVTALRHIGPVR